MPEERAFVIELYQEDTSMLQFLGDKFTLQIYQTYDGHHRPALKIDCYRQPDGTLVSSVEDWSKNEFGPAVMSH